MTFAKSKNFTDVPYNLVWDGEASADTDDGIIAILTFAVPKGIEKDYEINIKTSGVFDENVQSFKPTSINGKISVIDKVIEPKVSISWNGDYCNIELDTLEDGVIIRAASYIEQRMEGIVVFDKNKKTAVLKGDTIKIFFWKDNLAPVREAIVSTKSQQN